MPLTPAQLSAINTLFPLYYVQEQIQTKALQDLISLLSIHSHFADAACTTALSSIKTRLKGAADEISSLLT